MRHDNAVAAVNVLRRDSLYDAHVLCDIVWLLLAVVLHYVCDIGCHVLFSIQAPALHKARGWCGLVQQRHLGRPAYRVPVGQPLKCLQQAFGSFNMRTLPGGLGMAFVCVSVLLSRFPHHACACFRNAPLKYQ